MKSLELKVALDTLQQEDKAIRDGLFRDGRFDAAWEEYWQNYGKEFSRRERELKDEIQKEQYREIHVDDGVTIMMYSDRHAATVIKRTKITLTVQRDKATLDPNFKPEWIPGGFAAHCTNQNQQKWTYERDLNGAKTIFHWSEKYGCWRSGSDASIHLILGRHEFYDYNF